MPRKPCLSFCRKSLLLAALVMVPAFLACRAEAEQPYDLAWTRQLGTFHPDESWGVAVDTAGNVFISGRTYGSLGGPNAGYYDAFVSKYDTQGSLLWTRQLGSSGGDYSEGVATDDAGNVFISGLTGGSLGGPNAGGWDAFVSKYDTHGSLLWTRQLGTSYSDESWGVVADAAGSVFISGYTYGSLGGPNAGGDDTFVSKYDTDGSLLWTRQMGTDGTDWSNGVAADAAGNVFISGYTSGSLGGPNAGYYDAFVSKYDTQGGLLWTRQLGTSDSEWSYGVAADAAGSVFISGYTYGSLGGPNAGGLDAFVSKYDTDGSLLWTRQLGTSDWDYSEGVAADAAGNVFISGYTSGSLGGPNAGLEDVFVAKFVLPGDVNGDGMVGGADLTVIMTNWGLSGQPRNQGDLNGDGFVGGADYTEVLTYWGTGTPPEAIPEPATLGLVLLATGLFALGRRWIAR